MTDNQDYNLFFQFIEAFSPVGFSGIDPRHPLMVKLEQMMDRNDQFFYLADTIRMKILFTSNRSNAMIGVSPEDLSLDHFMEATHPEDIQRLSLGRVKLIKRAQDLYIAEKGSAILSTNFKIRNAGGNYSDFLVQNYLFFTTIPHKTVFLLKVHTNIDWSKKTKLCFHYYLGNDLSFFRYPDEEMLDTGRFFSVREIEIIRLVESGLSTKKIAEKLFLSPYTINTHRGNILQKSGKAHLSEVIYDLHERGLL